MGKELPVLGEVDAAKPWYADGLRFTCSQCGNCCTGGPGFVWISEVEVERLAAHLKLSVDEVLERYCRRIGARVSLNENRNARGEYDCVFLKEERAERREGDEVVVHTKRSCTIYPVRPLQCRTWPFWDGNLSSREIWESSAQRCHGMDRGRMFTREEIEQLRDAEDWPQRPPTSEQRAAKGKLRG
jgi:Fe-S-cluster containining protein